MNPHHEASFQPKYCSHLSRHTATLMPIGFTSDCVIRYLW